MISLNTSHGALRAAPPLLLLALLLFPAASALSQEVTVQDLLNNADDLMRGDSSMATMTMHVHTARWDRSLSMQVWTEGTDHSLIKILSPPKEKGMATLKVEDNIWNYLPKVDRTMKVPAAMMSGSWMGSHFSNDDLVKDSRMADDYTCDFASRPTENPEHQYVIDCTPNPDAPVVWGKLQVKLRGEDTLPVEYTFYDEKGILKRTMLFSDIEDVGGRRLPTRMKLVPADKPDESTEIIYEEINFDVDIPESTFTLQALKP